MSDPQEHYQNLLAPYYSWICGGFASNLKANRLFFQRHGIKPARSGVAVDLGAGCGFQSIPLAQAGFNVIAIDLCNERLLQLKKKATVFETAVAKIWTGTDYHNFRKKRQTESAPTCCRGCGVQWSL